LCQTVNCQPEREARQAEREANAGSNKEHPALGGAVESFTESISEPVVGVDKVMPIPVWYWRHESETIRTAGEKYERPGDVKRDRERRACDAHDPDPKPNQNLHLFYS